MQICNTVSCFHLLQYSFNACNSCVHKVPLRNRELIANRYIKYARNVYLDLCDSVVIFECLHTFVTFYYSVTITVHGYNG